MLGVHKILSHSKYLINQKRNSPHSVTQSSSRKYMKPDLSNILWKGSLGCSLEKKKTSLLCAIIIPSMPALWISALNTMHLFPSKTHTEVPDSLSIEPLNRQSTPALWDIKNITLILGCSSFSEFWFMMQLESPAEF